MAKVGYSRSMSRFTASKLRKSFGDKFYGIVTGTSFEAGRAGGALGCFRQSCSVLASAFLSSCLRSGDAGAIKIARDAAKRGGVSTKELAQMMRLEATGDRAGLRARPSKRVKEAPKEALKQLQKKRFKFSNSFEGPSARRMAWRMAGPVGPLRSTHRVPGRGPYRR